jgi:hypothetical protein
MAFWDCSDPSPFRIVSCFCHAAYVQSLQRVFGLCMGGISENTPPVHEVCTRSPSASSSLFQVKALNQPAVPPSLLHLRLRLSSRLRRFVLPSLLTGCGPTVSGQSGSYAGLPPSIQRRLTSRTCDSGSVASRIHALMEANNAVATVASRLPRPSENRRSLRCRDRCPARTCCRKWLRCCDGNLGSE